MAKQSALKVPTGLSPEKQAKVDAILKKYEEQNRQIEREHAKEMAKLYGGAALQIGSAFIPGTLGLKLAGGAIKGLTPIVGRKIAQNVATGVTSGLTSGAVEGLGRGLMENQNPLKTMATDSLAGGLLGGLGGYGLGKVAQKFENKKIPMTETDAFKNWFGNSKVVDENGNPKVVYHGSFNEFDTFDKSKQSPYSQYGGGFFFADDYDTAKMYGDNVYPVYLKAETNLRDAKNLGKTKDHIYDKNRGIWVVYEPEQIKSVNNQGTFDPTNPNIYKSILAPIGTGALAERLLNKEYNERNSY